MHIVGFITKQFITMHGHVEVKLAVDIYSLRKNGPMILRLLTATGTHVKET